MSSTVSKYKIKVTKVGRKWLTIESNCSKAQVEINEYTKDFTKGDIYDIYAECVTVRSRYGTTKQYYPMSYEEFNEIKIEIDKKECGKRLREYRSYSAPYEKMSDFIKKLAHGDEELLTKLSEIEEELKKKEDKTQLYYLINNIKSAKSFNSTALYKLEYVQKKISESKSLIERIQQTQPELYEELKRATLTVHEKIILNISSYKEMFKIFEGVNTLFEDIKTDNLLSMIKSEFNEFYLNKLDDIEKVYNEGFPILNNIYSEDTYKEFRLKKYISDKVNMRVEKLKEKCKNIDTSKTDYVIKNVFNVKNKESFIVSLSSRGFSSEKSSEIFDKYKFNEKIYILSYRLDKDFFKKALKKYGLEHIEYQGDLNPFLAYYHFEEYVCKNPYLLLYNLVQEGYIKLYENNEAYNGQDSEQECNNENDVRNKILLWSDELTEPFIYRKEKINEQIYYFVTKELYSYNLRDNYNAYYLVAWDNDTKRGFSHRLPWRENKYENMSVKEILEETFKLKQGYKRIQGDVIAKEYDLRKQIRTIDCIKIKTTVNGVQQVGEINSKSHKFEDLKSTIGNEFEESTVYYRKNLYVKGQKLKSLPSRTSFREIFKTATVYCNNKEVAHFDETVEFNQGNDGEKIKYDLYVNPIDFKIEYETGQEEEVHYELVNKDGGIVEKIKQTETEQSSFYLGEHEITCNYIKCLTRYPEIKISREVYCIGKFSIKHSEHTFVTYGEDDKAYKIELAIRHKKKR